MQPKGTQLSMFMTAGEILGQFQMLDADRGMRQQPIERGGEATQRPRRTDMGYNDPVRKNDAIVGYQRRKKDFAVGPESEEWARKRREADDSGLTESVAESGVVHPVNLGDVIGASGKPQITGGHHRIAASMGSDRLIPVLHHSGLLMTMVADMHRMGKQYR